ncbi:MAG: hypothetical protein Q7V58_11265 [Actinomycetota bacterium]|nr:hypothetical protein [Actinomycetota bacterium]
MTPRHLVLSCGALLAGGAVFGVVTTLAPSVSLPTATAETPTATPSGLGDEQITYPAAPDAAASPTALASRPAALPPSPTASPSQESPFASTTPSTPAPVSSPSTPRATPRATRAPRPPATPAPAQRPAPAATPPVVSKAPQRTTVLGGWHAPSLHVGANTIVLPRLDSAARVRVTVGCSPSSTCQVSGDQLVIDSAATSVTVTWWAPANGDYSSWQVSRGL